MVHNLTDKEGISRKIKRMENRLIIALCQVTEILCINSEKPWNVIPIRMFICKSLTIIFLLSLIIVMNLKTANIRNFSSINNHNNKLSLIKSLVISWSLYGMLSKYTKNRQFVFVGHGITRFLFFRGIMYEGGGWRNVVGEIFPTVRDLV